MFDVLHINLKYVFGTGPAAIYLTAVDLCTMSQSYLLFLGI
jgi:hypothetical protein